MVAGIFAAPRQPNSQAATRDHAQPEGSYQSLEPKSSLPFFRDQLTL